MRRMVLRKKAGGGLACGAVGAGPGAGAGAGPGSPPSLRSKLAAAAAHSGAREGNAVTARDRFVDNMGLLWKGPQGMREGRVLENHLHMQVAETVLFEGGEPRTWLFTSHKSGRFLKKNSDKVTVRAVVQSLGQRAEELFWNSARGGLALSEGAPRASGGGEQFVAVARLLLNDRDNLRVELLQAHQLLELLASPKQTQQLVALQACVAVTGCSAVYATRFRLADNGIGVEFETVRVTDDRGLVGGAGSAPPESEALAAMLLPRRSRERNVYIAANEVCIKSKAAVVNKEVERLTLQIVRFIEATRPGCVVDALRAEFVVVQGQPTTLTHISAVAYRKPLVRRLKALSPRSSEDSESQDSLFSSRSSNSNSSNGENAIGKGNEAAEARGGRAGLVGPHNPLAGLGLGHGLEHGLGLGLGPRHREPQRAAAPPTLEEEIKAVVHGPAGPARGRARCWGQYCNVGAAPGADEAMLLLPEAAHGLSERQHMQQLQQLKQLHAQQQLEQQRQQQQQQQQRDGGGKSGGGPPAAEEKVLLLSIVQAAIQKVHVRRPIANAKNQVNIEFQVDRAERPEAVDARAVSRDHKISSWRLYTPVDVCKPCFKVYQMIEATRSAWELKPVELPDPVAVSFSAAIKATGRLVSLQPMPGAPARREAALVLPFLLGKHGNEMSLLVSQRTERALGAGRDGDELVRDGKHEHQSRHQRQRQRQLNNDNEEADAAAAAGIARYEDAEAAGVAADTDAYDEHGGRVRASTNQRMSPMARGQRARPRPASARPAGAARRHDAAAAKDPLETWRAEFAIGGDTDSEEGAALFESKENDGLEQAQLAHPTAQRLGRPAQRPPSRQRQPQPQPQRVRPASASRLGPARRLVEPLAEPDELEPDEVNVSKTYRVAALHNKLSKELDTTLAAEDQVLHPPLFALRRKTFIPSERKGPHS